MYASIPLRSTAETNRVLRNAFGLLGISLIPTAIGAWVGTAIGLPALIAGSPLISSLVFMVLMFGALAFVNATSQSATGVFAALGFTFLMGAWLSGILAMALGAGGWSMIVTAALGTAAVAGGCSLYAVTTKRDFTKVGGFLFGSVIAIIVVSLANIFLQLPMLAMILSIVAIVVFSLFIVFDIQRVVQGGETNYVMAAMSLYLSLYNIFTSLLQLLLIFNSDD